MALEIFVGNRDKIKDRLIFDVEHAFTGTKLKDDAFTRRVLQEVEHGDYLDTDCFKDRFGRGLSSSCLSTGSKVLLLIAYKPDYVINASELGTNAFNLLLDISDGKLYTNNCILGFTEELKHGVFVNGRKCQDAQDAEYLIKLVEV